MSRNILHFAPTTISVLKLGSFFPQLSIGSVTSDSGIPTATGSKGVAPDAPTPKTEAPSFSRPFFRSGATAVAAIGLALVVGFGSIGNAHAQEADGCSREMAYSASIGAQLGRALTGDQNGGRIGGALAALIQRASCNNREAPAASAEMQRYNADLEEALRQDSAKFSGTAELSDGLKQVLTYLADQVRQQPGRKLVILGHANEPGAVAFNNRGLANERAQAAATFLGEKGIASARITYSGSSEGDGKNRLEILVIETSATRNNETQREGLFGIPGLNITIGGDRGHNNGVPNGTVNGGQHPRGRTQPPAPGTSGWNNR